MKIFWQMLEAKNLLQYFIINWFLQPAIGYWPFLLDTLIVIHSFPCWNSKHKILWNKFLGTIFMRKLNFWVPLREPKWHIPVCPSIHLPPSPRAFPPKPPGVKTQRNSTILSHDINFLSRRRFHYTMIVIHMDAAIHTPIFSFTTSKVLRYAAFVRHILK